MFKLPLATLIYAAAFHYAYVIYINPNFEYAHFLYIIPSQESLFFTYILIVIPVIGYRTSVASAAYGAVLIFALCYVPALLTMLFMWEKSGFELALAQVSLSISMLILLRASSWGAKGVNAIQIEHQMPGIGTTSKIIGILTTVSILLLVFNYHQYMRLVSFEDVYDLRLESNNTDKGILTNYGLMWLNYSFLPFYFARGIIQKSLVDLGIGLFGCILIYAATGAKAAILMPFIMYSINITFGSSKTFLFHFVMALGIIVFLVSTLIPDDGIGLWIKSILLIRTLGTGGWTITTYYDYFSTYGFTFYTHIGPINALTGAYPYGEYGLGQLIGIQYSGSADANFNANFWASDAFAALGIAGVPVVTIALCAVFFIINRISKNYSPRFVFLWLSGFWLSMLNLPLTTALLSGGGFMTMLLLWIASRMPKHTNSVVNKPSTYYG